MAFTNVVELNFGQEKITGTTKRGRLGTRATTPDGRVFRYALANGAILGGELCQNVVDAEGVDSPLDYDMSVEEGAVATDLASDGIAVGTRVLALLPTSILDTALDASRFEDGMLYINDGPGQGSVYRVQSHTSVDTVASSLVRVTLETDDVVIDTPLTTASLAGLISNLYRDVAVYNIETARDSEDTAGVAGAEGGTGVIPVGVAPGPVADNEYFWLQTWGLCAIKHDGANGMTHTGYQVFPGGDSDTAGAMAGLDNLATGTITDSALTDLEATSLDTDGLPRRFPPIGIMVGVRPDDGDYGLVFLTLAP